MRKDSGHVLKGNDAVKLVGEEKSKIKVGLHDSLDDGLDVSKGKFLPSDIRDADDEMAGILSGESAASLLSHHDEPCVGITEEKLCVSPRLE